MPRSRSRSPVGLPTSSSTSRRGGDRRRSRSRERRHRKKRSRSRSPRYRDSRASPTRHRSRSFSPRRRSPSPKKYSPREVIDVDKLDMDEEPITVPDVETVEADGPVEEVDMMKLMGFSSFDTTKGKRVKGNDVSAVHLVRKRRYRQYMNRRGGFNRPLDFIA